MKLITFAAGNKKYFEMAENLKNSAPDYETTIYTEKFLMQQEDFWTKHKDFITKNQRGYGYWIWKPFVIQQVMKTMQNNEILFYCDADFILKKDKKILEKLKKDVKNNKIISSFTRAREKELKWNKTDTINRLGVTIDEEDKQVQSGTLLIYVCDETRNLIDEWYSICCEKDYHYIDDSPSINPNYVSFEEHRHDQSIFSLLLKKHNIPYDTSIMIVLISHKIPIQNVRMRKRKH
jgi:hypothetical protein